MRNQFTDDKNVQAIYPDKKFSVEAVVEFVGYDFEGQEVDPQKEECIAKTGTDQLTGVTSHFVKFATHGMDRGNMFNALSPSYDAIQARRVYNSTGRAHYEFRKVNKEAFGYYLQFLRSGNLIHYKHAERAL